MLALLSLYHDIFSPKESGISFATFPYEFLHFWRFSNVGVICRQLFLGLFTTFCYGASEPRSLVEANTILQRQNMGGKAMIDFDQLSV